MGSGLKVVCDSPDRLDRQGPDRLDRQGQTDRHMTERQTERQTDMQTDRAGGRESARECGGESTIATGSEREREREM